MGYVRLNLNLKAASSSDYYNTINHSIEVENSSVDYYEIQRRLPAPQAGVTICPADFFSTFHGLVVENVDDTSNAAVSYTDAAGTARSVVVKQGGLPLVIDDVDPTVAIIISSSTAAAVDVIVSIFGD